MSRAPRTQNKLDLSSPHGLVELCFVSRTRPGASKVAGPTDWLEVGSLQENVVFERESPGFWGPRSPQMPMECREGAPA